MCKVSHLTHCKCSLALVVVAVVWNWTKPLMVSSCSSVCLSLSLLFSDLFQCNCRVSWYWIGVQQTQITVYVAFNLTLKYYWTTVLWFSTGTVYHNEHACKTFCFFFSHNKHCQENLGLSLNWIYLCLYTEFTVSSIEKYCNFPSVPHPTTTARCFC